MSTPEPDPAVAARLERLRARGRVAAPGPPSARPDTDVPTEETPLVVPSTARASAVPPIAPRRGRRVRRHVAQATRVLVGGVAIATTAAIVAALALDARPSGGAPASTPAAVVAPSPPVEQPPTIVVVRRHPVVVVPPDAAAASGPAPSPAAPVSEVVVPAPAPAPAPPPGPAPAPDAVSRAS